MILDNVELLKLYESDLEYFKRNKNKPDKIKRLIELRKDRTFDFFYKTKKKSLYILIEYVKLKIRRLKVK